MNTTYACAECLQTTHPLSNYRFNDLLGAEFVIFVCNLCIINLVSKVQDMTPAQQATYLTSLGQKVSKPFV